MGNTGMTKGTSL